MYDEITGAVKFISQELKINPDTDKSRLIDEASQKFNLTPVQTDFLVNKYILGE